MKDERKNRRIPSQPDQSGLAIVSKNGVRTSQRSWSSEIVQCPACLQEAEYTDAPERCATCGARLNLPAPESSYSGSVPNLVPIGHEVYYLQPPVRTVNERRYTRIPCRNVRAHIMTKLGSGTVVHLLNISRGGVCFTSAQEFHPGAEVSIATHYIEGGHNIYQDGRIIRVERMPSASMLGEYAIEFASVSATRPIPGQMVDDNRASI